MRLKYLSFIFLLCFAYSCGDDPVDCSYKPPVNFDPNVSADNIQTIEDYLATNGLTAQKTVNDLYYIIDEPGGSLMPNQCSNVLAEYVGYLPDGTEFDKSADGGTTFALANVIKGWQEGIPLFGLGGSGTILIPSKLGYGDTPPNQSPIPENSVLIFDITLLGF